MTTTELTQAGQVSPGRRSIVRSTLGGRRGQIAAGVAIAVAGLAFNWSWLVAAGIAPALLSLLPCVAMCALGLCMNRMTARSCQGGNDSAREGADSTKALSADMKGSG
ncbi:hypothetical protein RFN29_08785 [Mesorhizobium sp. VK22B]|uniref:DUF2892 domain-containing protein n=1 Tax=Mesorhizobium captivum TaxID=3072319 RepID=A0ABU4YXW1_9HYPH|nr:MULTISPECIES: hypothetical protein [unclassified Mesorhizobium]MDX8491673.1 hypothetical protein [Mesorhizobium sp. VK22B]MDX8504985.1 hypothetical protein [Mesorhizobium sp. VK22E]